MQTLTIATASETVDYGQAAYINGKKVEEDTTFYACDIARLCDGKATVIKAINVQGVEFPELESDLVLE
jgi:hypothetical protein